MNTVKIPQILLPENADYSAWAVNACDQFTSDQSYWRQVKEEVGDRLSAYNLIYPEIYLKDNTQSRIDNITKNMQAYINGNVFKEINGGFILVERTTQSGTRTGLVIAVDLEDYSYERGAKTFIRSTEATILERIPPRVKIRENAPIELPHTMLLYDDAENSVLSCVDRGEVLYDFDLNMNGGHVRGTFVKNSQEIIDKFAALLNVQTLIKKYGKAEKFLFAVGDGNHSLATAKTCWEAIKMNLSPEEAENHPARYALCEAVNLYDGALNFQPIHRLVKTDKTQKFLSEYVTSGNKIAYSVIDGNKTPVKFSSNVPQGIKELDEYIAKFILKNGGEVDYIHGEEEICKLSSQGVGIILPPIKKDDFFSLIISGGNLPKKTFSMGEGNEKRYYIEAKKIK